MTAGVFKSNAGHEAIQSYTRDLLARAPVPLRCREVPTCCGITHLYEAGPTTAPVLLLLHGSSSNSASWFGELATWSQVFRVLAVDIPGEPGLSEARRMRLTSEAASLWLVSLLDTLGVARAGIVGMSLGGFYGLHFATRHPGRVTALSLLAPSGLAAQRWSFLVKVVPLLFLGDWGLQRINRMVYGDLQMPAAILAFGRLVGRHFRPTTEPVPVFTEAQLAQLTMPVQYFGGAHDVLLRSRESAARLARFVPHAEVHLLPEAGHVILGAGDAILAFMQGAAGL